MRRQNKRFLNCVAGVEANPRFPRRRRHRAQLQLMLHLTRNGGPWNIVLDLMQRYGLIAGQAPILDWMLNPSTTLLKREPLASSRY